MPVNDVVIRVGGDSAEGGVVVTGEIIARVLARCGLEVFTFHTNPAEIKGGPVMIQVRSGEQTIHSTGDWADILICFNDEAWAQNGSYLRETGVLIHDSSFEPDEVRKRLPKYPNAPKVPKRTTRYALPFKEIAKKMRVPIAKNCVIMGTLSQFFGIPKEKFVEVFKQRWGNRGEKVIETNVRALDAGINAAREIEKTDPLRFEPRALKDRIFINGNEAICLGAVEAGCQMFAGYPITPATSILSWMEEHLPRFGGMAIQVEDEICSIGSVIGASYAGKKAMTATSGPGLSLMIEFFGLAAMAEVPCIIVNAMRGGPSTGLPTKTEQGDLNIAAWAGHGDVSRVVLAPSTVQGCFYTIIHAFNLAEICQVPVIVLTDTALANRNQTLPPIDLDVVRVADRATPTDGEATNGYKRYSLEGNGASPMSAPGRPGTYVATGLEHDEYGHPNWDPDNHRLMTEKRFKKLDMALNYSTFYPQFNPVSWYGPRQADIGIISWGSTGGAVREAELRAREEGHSVACLHVTMLNPLPARQIREFIRACRRVIIPELNYMGQFARLVKSHIPCDPVQINEATGLPIPVDEILQTIREVSQYGG